MYDASGVKLRKITNANGTIDTYDYVNGVEYKNNTLQRVANTEGAVVLNSTFSGYEHEYVLKDHIGNVRVTFSDANNDGVVSASDIKQFNNFYAFGLPMEGNWNGMAGANKYGYNNKEWNDDFGLGWNHHDWRFLDVALNRFVTVDRLPEEEDQEQLTPYQFALDNPIRYDDPDGQCPWCVGAIVGAITDIVVQTAEIAFDDNKTYKDFSVTSVVVSAAAGATGAGLATKLGKVGTLAKIGIEAAHDFGVSAAGQLIKDGKVDLKKAAIDVVAGKIAGEAAGKLVAKKAASSAEAKVLEKVANRAEKKAAKAVAAQEASNTAKAAHTTQKRANKAAQAKQNLSNHIAGKKAVASSTAASGVAGNAANKVAGTDEKK